MKSKMKRPINIATKTRTDRSLFIMTLTSPLVKANTPEAPASNIGIVRTRLLKNVSPPRCPQATRSRNAAISTAKAMIEPIDHLPGSVFGKILILTPLFFNVSRTHVK